jgi:iron complex outermembrane receptor protein
VFENDTRLRGSVPGALGIDINGDGDILDNVRVYTPSNTRTLRYTFLSSLVYELSPEHRLRVAYTFDRGRHRQTGEVSKVDLNGNPLNPFGGKIDFASRISTADGRTLQNRDRLSIAELQQGSFEYFGRFFDNRLTFTAGLRAPFFKRELNQYCFTQVTANNVRCTSEPVPANVVVIDPNVPRTGALPANGFYRPFSRTVKYSPILPSAGVSFDLTGNHSVYVSYGKNFSSPSTDNLYRSVNIRVEPETTNSYEGGYRYRSGRIQAQLATYYVDYRNRIVTAQDLDPNSQTFGSTLDRNVGNATAYGLDGQISWRPVRDLSFYTYASYIKSEIKNNVLGTAAAGNAACLPGTTVGTTCQTIAVNTAGAEFVETPKYTVGGRVQKDFGPLALGFEGRWVSKRFSTDDNGRVGTIANVGNLPIDSRGRTDDYAIFDADLRYDLDKFLPRSSFRVGVNNLFDKFYFGNINTSNTLAGGPRFSVGSPRSVQATLNVGF